MRRAQRPWPITFTAEGLNIARFLRLAGDAGLRLTDLHRSSPRRITAAIREADYPSLQVIARRGGWKITTGSRKGAGRAAEWLRRRWLLVGAVICGGIALLAASRVMWSVRIENAGSYEADIRAAVTDMGIAPPMLRAQVDLGELRDALQWRYPRIAWLECGWRGTALVIRTAEGSIPRSDGAAAECCDVIATRDGIIHRIVTDAGTPVVAPGDVVRAGEVLIRGEERTSDGGVRPVAARGSVIARVWLGASVRMPVTEVITEYTGREEKVCTIRTPWFDLWPMPDSAFAHYDTAVSEMSFGGIFLPMTLHSERRMEAEFTVTRRNQSALEAEAYAAAVRKLREKLGPDESLIDIWGNCSMIDDENLLSLAFGEIHAEIGKQVPASGMAASGQDTPE
jgi:similar to stage IV sporulation protein